MKVFSFSILFLIISFSLSYGQCPISQDPGIHVVQSNENLYRISNKYGVSIEQICQWNNISMDKVLSRCEKLIVSGSSSTPQKYNDYNNTNYNTQPYPSTLQKQGGNRHTVRSGETIAALARLYGYTEERFREFNALGNGDRATPGSIIFSSDCSCDRLSYNDPGKGNFNYTGNESGGNTGDPYAYNPCLLYTSPSPRD